MENTLQKVSMTSVNLCLFLAKTRHRNSHRQIYILLF